MSIPHISVCDHGHILIVECSTTEVLSTASSPRNQISFALSRKTYKFHGHILTKQPTYNRKNIAANAEWHRAEPFQQGLASSSIARKFTVRQDFRKRKLMSQIDANCSKQTSLASTTTEDKLAQHSGPSRTRHQLRLGTVSHPTSKSRLHSPVALSGLTYGAAKSASSEQSSRTKSAEIVAPRPRTACRFSYEDYKHTQIMGWLERGGGKEVNTIFFIPNLSSRLTVKADISSLGDKAGLRNEAASQYGSVSDCKLASDCVLDTGSVEAFSHQPSFSSLVAWDFGAKQRINPAR
jgi:hypothetical protein